MTYLPSSLHSAAFGLSGTFFSILTIVVEYIFAVEIIISKEKLSYFTIVKIDFLTEFWGDDYFHPVRDLKKIGIRYLK